MTPEKSKEFRNLEVKARTMDVLDRIHFSNMPRFIPATLATQALIGLHIKSVEVRSQKNLEEGLAEARDEGKEVIFTLRHKTDADTPVFRMGLRTIGREDVANNTVWIAGTNMLIRPHIFPFSFSEEVIYIATPDDLEGISNLMRDETLSPVEQQRSRWIDSTFRKMNNKAKAEAKDACERGKYLVFYPEAGRSRDGYLRRAPKEVSVYFPRDDKTIIIPVVINGTDQFNKPGEDISWEGVQPKNRKDVEIIFGKHYLSGRLWLVHKENKDIPPSDVAMAHIASTDPRRVRNEDMEYYSAILVKEEEIEARSNVA